VLLWCALHVAVALLAPVRGDERDHYAMPLASATEAWPGLSTTKLHHGLSPWYLWCAAAAGKTGLSPVVAARMLSLAAFAILAVSVVGALAPASRLWGLLVLLNPYVLLYAVRAHPFLPMLCALWFAWRWRESHPRRALTLFALASNFQPYALGLAAAAAWVAGGDWRARARVLAALVAAGLVGLAANWFVFGGLYPRAYRESDFMQALWSRSRPYPEIVLLALLLAGCYAWLACSRTPRRRLALALVVSAISGALCVAWVEPVGVLHSLIAASKLPTWPVWAAVLAVMGTGWACWRRFPVSLAMAIAGPACVLALQPFYYDRLAWFACLPGLLLHVTGDGVEPPSRAAGIIAAALSLLAYGVYSVVGSL